MSHAIRAYLVLLDYWWVVLLAVIAGAALLVSGVRGQKSSGGANGGGNKGSGSVAQAASGSASAQNPPKPPQNFNPQSPAVRTLVCTAGALEGRQFDITGCVRIGRDDSQCKIVYPKGTKGVSGVHCTVCFDGNTVTVTDHNSTCGTFINDREIPRGGKAVMHRGDTLCIGSRSNAFLLKGRSAR